MVAIVIEGRKPTGPEIFFVGIEFNPTERTGSGRWDDLARMAEACVYAIRSQATSCKKCLAVVPTGRLARSLSTGCLSITSILPSDDQTDSVPPLPIPEK
jgi:hypothetical protein